MIASIPIALNAPLWLLALPLPWLALRLRPHSRGKGARDLGQFIEPALQPWVVRGQLRPRGASALPWLAWGLLVMALCNPSLRHASPQSLPPAYDLAVIVDISPSMAADDMAPDRLTRLKLELRDFLRLAPPFRGALVVYSSEAYRLLPLTRDRAVFGHYIDALDLGMTRRRGSNLGQAIEIAKDTLEQGATRSGGLLVLTDGESFAQSDVEALAKRLGKANMPIFILGIGTPNGAPVPDGMGGLLLNEHGQAIMSGLNRAFLNRIARDSGGAYSDLHPDDSDWHTLMNAMTTTLQPYQNDDRAWNNLPLFPYLIGAAGLLMLWQGFRTPIAALCLFVVLIPMRPAVASGWNWSENAESRAYQALKEGDWHTAIRNYRASRDFAGLMGLGFAQYRAGSFEEARVAFTDALAVARAQSPTDSERAQAAYNLGTTEARLKNWKAAQAALNKALSFQPDYPEARQNLRFVEQAMRAAHAGLRNSETAKTMRTDPSEGLLDTKLNTAKTEDETRQNPEAAQSQSDRVNLALRQWGLDTGQTSRREDRVEDDIRTVVRYRIARQENARPPLELEMPPW